MANRRLIGGRWARPVVWGFVAALALPLASRAAFVFGHDYDWRTAPRHSIGIAPDPATTPEAVVQVYAARAFGWRGAFGVHTWIAVKPTGAPAFEVHEAIGWYALRGQPVVRRSQRPALRPALTAAGRPSHRPIRPCLKTSIPLPLGYLEEGLQVLGCQRYAFRHALRKLHVAAKGELSGARRYPSRQESD